MNKVFHKSTDVDLYIVSHYSSQEDISETWFTPSNKNSVQSSKLEHNIVVHTHFNSFTPK